MSMLATKRTQRGCGAGACAKVVVIEIWSTYGNFESMSQGMENSQISHSVHTAHKQFFVFFFFLKKKQFFLYATNLRKLRKQRNVTQRVVFILQTERLLFRPIWASSMHVHSADRGARTWQKLALYHMPFSYMHFDRWQALLTLGFCKIALEIKLCLKTCLYVKFSPFSGTNGE